MWALTQLNRAVEQADETTWTPEQILADATSYMYQDEPAGAIFPTEGNNQPAVARRMLAWAAIGNQRTLGELKKVLDDAATAFGCVYDSAMPGRAGTYEGLEEAKLTTETGWLVVLSSLRSALHEAVVIGVQDGSSSPQA